MQTKTYRLPPSFYHDHVMRDLPSGTLVRETKTYVVVDLDREAYDDLVSDASFYLDCARLGSFSDPAAMLGTVSSARATLKRLLDDPFPADDAPAPVADDVPLVDVPGPGRRIRPYDRHATRRKAERDLADLRLGWTLDARLVRTSDPDFPFAIETNDAETIARLVAERKAA